MNPLLVRAKREADKWRDEGKDLPEMLEEARKLARAKAQLDEFFEKNLFVYNRIQKVIWKRDMTERWVLAEMKRCANPSASYIIEEVIAQEYRSALNHIDYTWLIDEIAENAAKRKGPTREQLDEVNRLLANKKHPGFPKMEEHILELLAKVDSEIK